MKERITPQNTPGQHQSGQGDPVPVENTDGIDDRSMGRSLSASIFRIPRELGFELIRGSVPVRHIAGLNVLDSRVG
jgi:hypothetical protein